MRIVCASALVMLSLFLGPAALAATVEPVQGKVSINRGGGYKPLSGPSQATAGVLVMVAPGGRARVVYDDQCSVAVKPGHVVAIAPEPPCKKTASFDPYGTLPAVVISGGLAVAAGLCIAEHGICDNKDRAASP